METRTLETVDLAEARSVRRSTFALGITVGVLAASIAIIAADDAPLWVGPLLALGLGAATTLMVRMALVGPVLGRTAALTSALVAAETHRRREEELDRILTQAEAALDQASGAEEAIAVTARATHALFPDHAAHLLRPDEHRWPAAGRRWFGPHGAGTAEEVTDGRCRATAGRRVVVCDSTAQLDACPHLADLDAERSSVCLPILASDDVWGSLHLLGPVAVAPEPDAVVTLERIVRCLGQRLTVLHSVPAPRRGAPDPLTGLIDRRGFDAELRTVTATSAGTTSVVLCDIDDHTGYVHTYGADAGDRAVQVIADTIVGSLRPGDLAARIDNDAFGLILGRCTAEQATAATERIRERLVLRLAEEGLAPFGWSAGIADDDSADSPEALLEAADLALVLAKREGGGRVRTAAAIVAPDDASTD